MTAPTLLRVEPVQPDPGYRPGLRLVVEFDGAPATTVAAYHPQPDARFFPCFSWSPETGRYCMSQVEHPDAVAIPADEVWRLAGLEPAVLAKAIEVERLVRPGRRALRKGQTVTVQAKQAKGTRKDHGLVKAVFDDGTVQVATGTAVVEVDAEWVQATNGGK